MESVAADLRDAAARRALFERIGRDSKKTLVLSEGLLVYLTPDEVGALATDLHAPESFRWWAIDIVAPQLLRRLNRQWAPTLAAGRAVLQFAPENGTRFFEPYGWKEAEYRSTFEEGHRLRRHMRGAWIYRLIGKLAGPRGQEKMRRIGGIALLARSERVATDLLNVLGAVARAGGDKPRPYDPDEAISRTPATRRSISSCVV